ncbi:PilZ domain-containing protein [Pseudidiomarina sp. E22-M8]|uniref:PilZ domain-containing protein n=1 Tax=Pseudidiomarina sp. E22-M8 TaxID=3424768 RepID=UPI00403C1FF3
MAAKRIHLKSEEQLRRMFMPFIKGGALFVATDDPYSIGDELSLLIRLPGDSDETLVKGKVVWLAPARPGRTDQRGVGVQFLEDKSHLRNRIDTLLGHLGESTAPTATM